MTSIALSGRCRSLMKRADSSAAVVSAAAEYLMPWCASKRVLRPRRMAHGFLYRRFDHVDFLEAARQGVVFLEYAAVFVIGGGADALQAARTKRGFEQVGRIQRAARCGAGADQGVDLVDEQDCIAVIQQLLQHRLQALLEVAAVLGAREQCAHVERVNLAARQHFRARCLRRCAAPGLRRSRSCPRRPRPPAADCSCAGGRASGSRARASRSRPISGSILPDQGLRVQIERVVFERRSGLLLLLLLAPFRPLGGRRRTWLDPCEMKLTTSSRVMPCWCRKYTACESFSPKIATNTLAPVTSFLPEDCTCRMARWITRWKPSVGWVSISSVPATVGCARRRNRPSTFAQIVDVGGAGAQDLGSGGIVQQRQQQMLHGDELVALLPRLDKRHVQADFEFLRNHLKFPPSRTATGVLIKKN